MALSDGSGDAFLHANTLNQSGHSAVSPGATLRVRIGQGQKGRQVSEVLSVDESTATPTAGRGASGAARGPRHPVASAIEAAASGRLAVIGAHRLVEAPRPGLRWRCRVP